MYCIYLYYTYLPMLLILFIDDWNYAPNGWQMIKLTFLGQFRPKLIFSLGFFLVVDGVGGKNWLTGQAIQEKGEDFHSRQLAFGDGPDVLWVMLFRNLTNGSIMIYAVLFWFLLPLTCFQIDTKGAFAVFVSVFSAFQACQEGILCRHRHSLIVFVWNGKVTMVL